MVEDQFAVGNGDFDGLIRLDVAAQEFLGERILQIFLHRPTQRSRAELRVVSLLNEEVRGRLRETDLDILVFEAGLDL